MNRVYQKEVHYGLKIIIATAIWTVWATNLAVACEYNVRETGFVDFADEQYRFYGYVNRQTDATAALYFEQAIASVFADCNVVAEIVNIDEKKAHSAIKYLKQFHIDSFPSAVLVSPDSQVYDIRFDRTTQTGETQPYHNSLLRLISSPLRDKIIAQAIRTYGVILLINGGTSQSNDNARRAINQSMQSIKRQMNLMPKAIAHPPVVVELNAKQFKQERELLRSLGLHSNTIADTYAAVIYGKARWLGPLLQGQEIAENNLFNILSIIGQDCECGLDMRVMRGIMLPIKWQPHIKTLAVEQIGFDPDNPFIKMKISQILRKGLTSFPGVPIQQRTSRTKISIQDDPLYVEDGNPYIKKSIYYLFGFAGVVLLAGLFVIARMKRKDV